MLEFLKLLQIFMDFGLFMPYENPFDTVLLIPWPGITIPFGNTR